MGRGTRADLLYGEAPSTRTRAEAPSSFGELHSSFAAIVPALRHAREKELGAFKAGFVSRKLGGALGVHEVEVMLEALAEAGVVSRSVHDCCRRTGNTVGIDSGTERLECAACGTAHDSSELFAEVRYKVLIGE